MFLTDPIPSSQSCTSGPACWQTRPMAEASHDPRRYGTSFAEVYDRWYPGGDEDAACRFLTRRLPPGARILELGTGTGRLALRLAAAGFDVVGLDASEEMLDHLAEKDPGRVVATVRADAGAPDTWVRAGLSGRFDAVLAACNLLLNLTVPGAQQACVRGSSELLGPGGILVTELSPLEAPTTVGREVTLSSVESDGVVLIATETDPGSAVVEGRHIELRDGAPVRVRPWSIRVATTRDLDGWCEGAGLELVERDDGWDPTAPTGGAPATVSVHRR